jgi:hypothetical protein
MQTNLLLRTLLKKVQMQGDTRWAERGVLQVRRNECPSASTPQMGLFQLFGRLLKKVQMQGDTRWAE